MERRDEVQALSGRDPEGLVPRFVEITAELDHPGAEAGDGRILVEGIVARNIDGRRYPGPRRSERDGLTMIAARRRNDSGDLRGGAAQAIQVHQAAADFERTGGRVILMFHPYLAACAFGQLRPRVLRCRRQNPVYQCCGTFQVAHSKQG